MTLSIFCITYNHKEFIAQALESFLMQKTSFNYEIVVGDDCSTDGTRDILADFKNRFPDKITLLLNDTNIGVVPNFIQTFKACKGKYVAVCEGDDFWTDNQKLQKQVDFLEANTDYAICFHNVEKRFENDPARHSFLYCANDIKPTSTIEDLCYRNYIPTCSMVFRNHLFTDFPEWYPKQKLGDWTLSILNAQYGKIKYMPQVMGVYRFHTGGVWSLQDEKKSIGYILNTYDVLIEYFSDKKDWVYRLKKGRRVFEKKLHKKNNGLLNKIQDKIIRMIHA
jgi:glycosyltransferase involved in cell wall biosynthesis